MAANSNPEAQEFQSQQIDGVTIAQQMVDACEALNSTHRSDVGIVVGATLSYALDLSRFAGSLVASMR